MFKEVRLAKPQIAIASEAAGVICIWVKRQDVTSNLHRISLKNQPAVYNISI